MKNTNCKLCENTGIKYVPNGADDYDMEYCSCPEGKRAEKAGAMKVLHVNFIESEGAPMLIR